MPFNIVRQDITKMDVDAVVNAANTDLRMGGGVCGAIFKAAGPGELQAACDELAPIQTGGAVITPGFKLRAKYVIHTAGPIYSNWSREQSEQYLRSCYVGSFDLAAGSGCKSIAFPLISSGIYGYPKDEALSVATSSITGWPGIGDMDVFLAVFDKEAFAVSEKLLGGVESYIDEHYVDARHVLRERDLFYELNSENVDLAEEDDDFHDATHASIAYHKAISIHGIEALVGKLDEPFSDTLLRLIDAKGRTDVEVYKRANIDRKLFSKIRTGRRYIPSKRTAIALAVALELSLAETDDLLKRAGYALSHSQMFDVIIEYFIVSGKYDVFEINEVLFKYDQPLLGG
jgi:O-acetyl-ADP-ribose deacetylase (regulator of RNase III)